MGAVVHFLVCCGGNDPIIPSFKGEQDGASSALAVVLSFIC